MRSVLREPLLHFVLIGAALFGISLLLRRPEAAGGDRRIVVGRGHLEQMTIGFTRTWRRPPTREELDRLVQDHILEQALAREAQAMGLGDDDVIIRRRLRQKMEALLQDVGAMEEPTDAGLRDFLAKNPDLFRIDSTAAFRQVYLSREKRGAAADAQAAALLDRLRKGEPPDALGDPSLLSLDFPATTRTDLDRQFGGDFVRRLFATAPGTWEGPIASSYGLHLVRISELVPGRVPDLDAVKDAVRTEWAASRRRAAMDDACRKILERYTVVVETP